MQGRWPRKGDRGWGCSRQAQAFVPSALTLEGVVVGLDALTDGLFQVPLLHTLDPQVLETESPPQASVALSPASVGPLAFPSQPLPPRPSCQTIGPDHQPPEWLPTVLQ